MWSQRVEQDNSLGHGWPKLCGLPGGRRPGSTPVAGGCAGRELRQVPLGPALEELNQPPESCVGR
jgi:hypothetical protein